MSASDPAVHAVGKEGTADGAELDGGSRQPQEKVTAADGGATQGERLHDDEMTSAEHNNREPLRDPTMRCACCGLTMGTDQSPTTKDGPIHFGCVLEYRFLHQPRCHYCGIRFLDSEATKFVKDDATGKLYHAECRQQMLKGVPYTRPSKEGEVRKFSIARSKLSRHNWKTRYFVLNSVYNGIRYFESNPHTEGKEKEKAKERKDGKKESSSSDSAGSDDAFDADADPKLAVGEHAKKAKGFVPLDHRRARLVTHPADSIHKIASTAPTQNDIIVVFFDSPESNTEHRLLFQCKSPAEKQSWVRALESYIHTVDDPKDYGVSREKDKKK